MTPLEKYRRAVGCLQQIAKYGHLMLSDSLARECLDDLGESSATSPHQGRYEAPQQHGRKGTG